MSAWHIPAGFTFIRSRDCKGPAGFWATDGAEPGDLTRRCKGSRSPRSPGQTPSVLSCSGQKPGDPSLPPPPPATSKPAGPRLQSRPCLPTVRTLLLDPSRGRLTDSPQQPSSSPLQTIHNPAAEGLTAPSPHPRLAHSTGSTSQPHTQAHEARPHLLPRHHPTCLLLPLTTGSHLRPFAPRLCPRGATAPGVTLRELAPAEGQHGGRASPQAAMTLGGGTGAQA